MATPEQLAATVAPDPGRQRRLILAVIATAKLMAAKTAWKTSFTAAT